MVDSSIENQLDDLVKRANTEKAQNLTSVDVDVLVAALSTGSDDYHSKIYVILSTYCHPTSSTSSSRPTEEIVSLFLPKVLSLVDGSDPSNAVAGLSLLVALFQVHAPAASQIFISEGIFESLMDLRDISSDTLLFETLVRLIGQAAGQKNCRAIITDECVSWLQGQVQSASGERIQAAAAVGLVKLQQGTNLDSTSLSQPHSLALFDEEHNIDFMRRQLITSRDHNISADLVEGLAYASRQPEVKETLSKDKKFIEALLRLVPQHKSAASQQSTRGSTLIFGVVVIILNLVAYRPRLSGEKAQMERLRRMANAGPGSSGKLEDQTTNKLDEEVFVQFRARRLLDAGAHVTLVTAVRLSESRGVRLAAGKALLNLIEDKNNRGKILQVGGAKALMTIIRTLNPETATSEDLECIQALAKLAITSSPVQVFGADEGAMIDAIRPFSILLTHSLSDLLQQFESLMALTNLSSQGLLLAERIAVAEGLSNKLDLLLLEDHVLIRRAAIELICNLVAGSESMLNKYSNSKSKLQIVVALTDVDDEPTRLASSGALAALTTSPKACSALCQLQLERHRTLSLLVRLLEPSPTPDSDHENSADTKPTNLGLIHRGVVCLRNLLVGTPDAQRKKMAEEAETAGVARAIVQIVKTNQDAESEVPFMAPAIETLKWLLAAGVSIQI